MNAKILSPFEAEINGVKIVNETIYYETEDILAEIEDVLKIDLPTSFIKDFISLYEELYSKVNGEDEYEFKCDMARSWENDIKNPSELKFELNPFIYDNRVFETINSNLSNWENIYGKHPEKLEVVKVEEK